MGTYLNPGNIGFERIVKKGYVDKTGLIEIINKSIDTPDNLTCISRPRRFGKSYAAQMLSAYYDKSCDSKALFENYAISKDETYDKHLNKYDVIYLDMTQVTGEAGKDSFVDFIKHFTVISDKIAVGNLTGVEVEDGVDAGEITFF